MCRFCTSHLSRVKMELQTRLQPTGRDPTTKPPNKQKITRPWAIFWGNTKKWTIIDWKVNVSKPAPIHGEHQSPAQWPHTRIFPGKTKLVLQPRSSTQTYNQESNNIQQTYTKPTFSRSPKPTNDKQPTNQKEWLSAKYTWNALAQVWSAPFEEAPGLQC